MNTTGKVLIGIVVIVVIAGVGYYAYTMMSDKMPTTTSMTASSTGTAMPMATGEASAAANPLPAGTSTSDAALSQDTAAIDAQMNGLDSDNTNVTSSVNQPAQ